MQVIRIATLVFALGLTAAAATGCTARVYTPRGVIVRSAPPPPRYEVVPVAPRAGYVWVGGYWSWGGSRYVWSPGHYVVARVGHSYARPHWVRVGRHYRFVPGHWVARAEPRVYRRRAPPPPAYRY